MFDHMWAYYDATHDGKWTNVINKTYTVVNTIFSNNSSSTGLIPDFVVLNGSTYQPAPANFLESANDGKYSYNSCRTPWRFSTEYTVRGSSGILSEMRKMNSWIQSKSGGNPDNVFPGYSLSGTALDTSYTDDSFTSPFAVCSMIDSSNQTWLNSLWSWIAARGINTGDGYFGNSITMQSVLVLSANWWAPSYGAAADFSVAATPDSDSVTPGDTASYTATVTPVNGFNGVVTFSVTGLPTGANGTFTPTSVTGSGSSSLTVTTSSSTPAGTYTLTVKGTSGSTVHSDTVTLVVADFTVSATPASQTVTTGSNTTYTVTVGNVNAFSGTVALDVAGLPANATGTFNPTSVNGLGSSTLTITTATNTPTGSNTLTITGTSGTLAHSATVGLVVNSPSSSLLYEAESISYVTNGATANVIADSAASGGNWVSLLSTNSGPWIEYTLPSVPAGTYDLTLLYKQHPNRCIMSLTVDGVKLDGDLDQYSATPSFVSKDFGVITFKSAGNHVVRLTATGKNASAGTPNLSADAFQLTPTAQTWLDQDIGAVGLAGSFSQSAGTYTVAGSGSDIWTAADQFHYAYQAVSGDVTITARVVSETQTSSYCKAAVMLRASLATNSVEASVLLTPTNGVAMEVRSTTGASTINVSGWVKGPVPPSWVRLSRSGNTFTAFSSADGSSWTQLASTNVTMSAGLTAGLAVTSHDNTKLNTSTFDNVSLP
jgi:regulation of enolase protein 1 (concanavalin A-like superfamily)